MGVDVARVAVLQGEAGARMPDFDGTEQGFLAHDHPSSITGWQVEDLERVEIGFAR